MPMYHKERSEMDSLSFKRAWRGIEHDEQEISWWRLGRQLEGRRLVASGRQPNDQGWRRCVFGFFREEEEGIGAGKGPGLKEKIGCRQGGMGG